MSLGSERYGQNNSHHEPASLIGPLLQHEVQGEITGELDETVVFRLCDDEYIADVGLDPSPACNDQLRRLRWRKERK
jgi:hypothetical protein